MIVNSAISNIITTFETVYKILSQPTEPPKEKVEPQTATAK